MTDQQLAICLRTIEHQVERLTVHHRKPEKFHEDKSQIVHDIGQLRAFVEARR